MTDMDQAIEAAKAIKSKYEDELMKKAHVVGVGVGFKKDNGVPTDEVAIIVNVSQPLDPANSAPIDTIPDTLEGISVQIQETGVIRAMADQPKSVLENLTEIWHNLQAQFWTKK